MGRGAYYKAKYGRGGRGGRRNGDGQRNSSPRRKQPCSNRNFAAAELRETLFRIHHKSYGAYHDIGNVQYQFDTKPNFIFCVNHVQSDPFAAASRAYAVIEQENAHFPPETYSTKLRRIALADFLTRRFCAVAARYRASQRAGGQGWHGAKGGDISMDCPGQHVLERTSVIVSEYGSIEARFTVGLPARGRTICGDWAAEILCETLPRLVAESFSFPSLSYNSIKEHLQSIEDQGKQ